MVFAAARLAKYWQDTGMILAQDMPQLGQVYEVLSPSSDSDFPG